MRNISELEQELRDLINHPRKRLQLSRNRAAFNKLCSSLDVLGDTEVAFAAYLSGPEERRDGEEYLLLYGVLQALILQQDAVRHVHEALGTGYKPNPSLKSIREARNKASGHPTEMKRKGATTFHQISRVSITKPGFTLVSTGTDGDLNFEEMEVPPMIVRQREILGESLAETVRKLMNEETEHRKRFRSEKLVDIFPKSLGHTYEKIAETIHRGLPSGFGASLVESIITAVAQFKGALDVRDDLDVYEDSVGNLLREIEYALDVLSSYFSDTQESKLNSQDAEIFLFFVHKRIEDLIALAREIDEEYATDLPD